MIEEDTIIKLEDNNLLQYLHILKIIMKGVLMGHILILMLLILCLLNLIKTFIF